MLTSQAIDLFIHSRSARNDAASTLKWYRIILEYFEVLYPGELPTNPEAIDIFLSSCKGGDERRHGFYRTLRAFFRFLEKRYQIPNPVKLIDPPRRKRKLTRPLLPTDLSKLLSYNHENRITAYILFLTDTGARISELDALMPEHILQMPWGPVARLTVNG
jgi:integrase